MTTRGVDIRQSSGRLVFRASLKDANGAMVTSGTTELRIYRANDDGTLDTFDWLNFDFHTTASGHVIDDETTMTHQQRLDDVLVTANTGVWTKVLTTLTAFTEGQIYVAQVTNSLAFPESQEREFQFGGVEGDQASADLQEADSYIKTTTTPWQLVLIKRGSGNLNTGTVLLTKDLKDVDAANVTDIATFVAQSVSP